MTLTASPVAAGIAAGILSSAIGTTIAFFFAYDRRDERTLSSRIGQ